MSQAQSQPSPSASPAPRNAADDAEPEVEIKDDEVRSGDEEADRGQGHWVGKPTVLAATRPCRIRAHEDAPPAHPASGSSHSSVLSAAHGLFVTPLQPVVSQHPLLELANSLFVLSLPAASVPAAERADLTARINAKIEADSMAPFLKYLQSTQGWEVDPAKLEAMEKANAAALVSAEAKIVEATEVAGDTEVREAMLTRANLHAQWGDKEKALEEYNLVFDKTVGVASKIDVLLARMRVALAFDDLKKFKHDIDKAKGYNQQRTDGPQ